MATMVMPLQGQMYEFEMAEKKVERVDAGVTFAQGMNLVIRTAFSIFHLTSAFHSAVQVQNDLIAKLVEPSVQYLSPEQYAFLAEKIEHLVSLNEHVIRTAPEVVFNPWGTYLEQLQDQSEHLAGIAESFRMACDEEALGILASIASDITSSHTEQLVGAMHA